MLGSVEVGVAETEVVDQRGSKNGSEAQREVHSGVMHVVTKTRRRGRIVGKAVRHERHRLRVAGNENAAK